MAPEAIGAGTIKRLAERRTGGAPQITGRVWAPNGGQKR
jgi:hypothetical protein